MRHVKNMYKIITGTQMLTRLENNNEVNKMKVALTEFIKKTLRKNTE